MLLIFYIIRNDCIIFQFSNIYNLFNKGFTLLWWLLLCLNTCQYKGIALGELIDQRVCIILRVQDWNRESDLLGGWRTRLKENTEKAWAVAKTEQSTVGEGGPAVSREGYRALLWQTTGKNRIHTTLQKSAQSPLDNSILLHTAPVCSTGERFLSWRAGSCQRERRKGGKVSWKEQREDLLKDVCFWRQDCCLIASIGMISAVTILTTLER